MNKRIILPVLLVLSLFSLAYAIYRSTAQRITVLENNQEVVYGEPQHGLILGLCIFSATCLLAVVLLLLDRQEIKQELKKEEPNPVIKRSASNYPQ